MGKKLLICLDYDNTFTADPELWTGFIVSALAKGHKVICATMRYKEEGAELEESIGKHCKIFYTDRRSKHLFLTEIGIFPDIWIDDSPYWILYDATDRIGGAFK